MARNKTAPPLGGTLRIEPAESDAAAEHAEQPTLEGDEVLDPKTSARRYWRDPLSGTQREIWRPGRPHQYGRKRVANC